jgi:hypothetical protein
MQPDDEPDLKAAFAELHRRRREHAPAFEPMRERALRKANESPVARRVTSASTRLAWAGAACALAMVIWWAAQTPRDGGMSIPGTAPKENVEELITAIEQHLEVNDTGMEYPTDLLLVGNQADFSE